MNQNAPADTVSDPVPKVGRSGIGQTAVIFGVGAICCAWATRAGQAPWSQWIEEPMLRWFGVASVGLFLPILLIGWIVLKSESITLNGPELSRRLRLQPMDGHQGSVLARGFASITLGTLVIMGILYQLTGGLPETPEFLKFEPLDASRMWLLLVWLPFFALNILSEEWVWRGIVLPRQEAVFGRWAWLANGIGWWALHLPFGGHTLWLLLPICLVLPYQVQKHGSTRLGIYLHAGFNGPGFLATAFGWV